MGTSSKAVPTLKEYSRKRRFGTTPEPEPNRSASLAVVPSPIHAGRFCVQEHHASHLHYDLRLEIAGVLKSWAVPKGPSLDPEVRRLAMATEDHPLEYLTFEGKIPEGNYGAGEVIVWDMGEYEPVGDTPPLRQWEQGHLKFRLHGEKLHGEFALAHLPARPLKTVEPAPQPRDNQWLLIKKHDEAGRFGDSADQHPGSVIKPSEPPPRSKLRLITKPASMAEPPSAPMLATLGAKLFSDPDWLFEVKWDGIRAFARLRRGKVALTSRTGRDVSAQYPELTRFPATIDAVLDGEIVALDAEGRSSFHRLQQRMNLSGRTAIARAAMQVPVVFYAFDLLTLRGRDLTCLPLAERKSQLAALPWSEPWRYSDHIVGDGVGLFDLARQRGLEGIVAKRAESAYQPGRSRDWIKFKTAQRQEAVIVGYTDPLGERSTFGALLLAVFNPASRQFEYIGRVGTGFDARTRADILRRLRRVPRPSATVPGRFHAVAPELVAEIKFAEWTAAGRLRAPVFLGLRTDKPPRECVREVAGA
ncbi:MAG TPA: non-homologous end-joining DNA ligase [Terriglobales bacterium]|nr:non-homologous end-joining DNA ligase [Terriglobales bacterium]